MREKTLFDFGWKFHDGELEMPEIVTSSVYIQAKTERAAWGPASYGYAENNREKCPVRWEDVDLPHDYIITQEPEEKYNCNLGYFNYHGAWYRKRFALSDADRTKRITLLFEGIAVHSEVHVNGCLMARNFCGYNSFEVDITDVARFGEENVVAVHTDASSHEGWWYEGAGIYRHVWLTKTEKISVDLWGVWVNPQKQNDGFWNVPVETTLRSDSDSAESAELRNTILDEAGNEIAFCAETTALPEREKTAVRQMLRVSAPALWDVDAPHLYTMRTTLLRNGEEIDRVETRFGFRTIRFDAKEGFFLNGRRVEIKGVCCHQDYGLTGKAMPDRVHRYRLRRLKEMGANGYRASHYPPAEATMNALDELGFLVMDETRWFESTPDGLRLLEMMVKRDRNHPSVILWSVGNEEPLHTAEAGRRIMLSMKAFLRKLDSTRPVTTAICNDPLNSTAAAVSDVIGVNYNLNQYDDIHAKYPDKPIVSSECCAVGTTRGWYFDDEPLRGYLRAYDHPVGGFSVDREGTWKHFTARPWVCGEYQWAGIEHRGECVWPRLCSQSGALDLFLQPKDAYYENMAHWTEKPMIHLLPHWNLAGREGELIPVWAYTNCEEAELFLNGRSLGRKKLQKFDHAEWQVPYAPGELRAAAYRGGSPAAEDAVKTSGPAAALKLRLEDGSLTADGEDMAIVTCWCEDQNGVPVPDASPMIHFDCGSLGKIVGTGSDVSDHTPVPCPDRRMRAGLCSLAVRIGKTPGTLKIYARAEGLAPAALSCEVLPASR